MSSWETLPDVDPRELAPWDRQPGEAATTFEAFLVYRDLGPGRSLRLLSEHGHTISATTAAKHNWRERAEQWDDYRERIRRNEIIKETREMAARQARQASDMSDALMAPVKALQKKLDRDPEATMAQLETLPLDKLINKIQASARVLQPMMNAERLARGLPTEISEGRQEHVHSIDYGDAERIDRILDALRETPQLLAHVLGEGTSGEIVDAEVVEVHPDRPASEADGLPSSATA